METFPFIFPFIKKRIGCMVAELTARIIEFISDAFITMKVNMNRWSIIRKYQDLIIL